MGWDEIMDGDINTSAMVHCWRNPSFGIKAAQKGHDVVLSPTKYCYFDFYQANPRAVHEPLAIGGYLPVDSVYNMDTMPKDISPENRKDRVCCSSKSCRIHAASTHGSACRECMGEGQRPIFSLPSTLDTSQIAL